MRAEALCADTALATSASVQVPELLEASGIAASTHNDGIIWGHNDSGDVPRVFTFDTQGAARGVYAVEGAEAIDWEDMALGPGPDGDSYLYLGDIGDNGAERPQITVYRAPERVVDGAGGTLQAEAITLRYPDSAHDAETLLVDPRTGDLLIVTKELISGDAGIYRAAADALTSGEPVILERAGTIEKRLLTPADAPPDDAGVLVRGVGYLPTGGDISRDGALIAIRTYATVFIWAREEGESVADALAGPPCEAASVVEPQGEAITFAVDADAYFTLSEGANPPLYRFGEE